MKFNHLNVPTHWRNYWSRYPEGHTILEALISWVSQVDSMVDNQNKLNDNVAQFRKEIDDFVGRFDERLQTEVTQTLKDWQDSGFLDVVISEALQWQLTDYIATNEADKTSITTQLTETQNKIKYLFIDVRDYGAKGDGLTDDTISIQNAIDDISDNYPNYTLFFPKNHTFLVGTMDSDKVFLYLKPSVNIDGFGTIKVKENIGNFRCVIEQAGVSKDISIKNITIDSNNQNNPLQAPPTNDDYIIRTELFFRDGDNYLFENITIKNSVGVWSIITNGLTNLIIRNCKGVNIGNTTFEYDTSFIYVDGDNAIIENNHIVSAGKGVSTAIEVHKSNILVRNNIIDGYRTGILYASEYAEAKNVHIHGNILNKVCAGVQVWATEYPIYNISIHQNDIEVDNLYFGSYGLDGITVTDISTNEIHNMTIKDNKIVFNRTLKYTKRNGVYNGGIIISNPKIYGVIIENNMIENPVQLGIGVAPATVHNLIIGRNIIKNAGLTLEDYYRFGIVLRETQSLLNTKLIDNIIVDNRETKITEVGIACLFSSPDTNGSKDHLKFINNEIQKEINQYSGHTKFYISDTHVRQTTNNPNGYTVPYRIGEEIYDLTNNIWYKAKGLTNNDWVALNSASV